MQNDGHEGMTIAAGRPAGRPTDRPTAFMYGNWAGCFQAGGRTRTGRARQREKFETNGQRGEGGWREGGRDGGDATAMVHVS